MHDSVWSAHSQNQLKCQLQQVIVTWEDQLNDYLSPVWTVITVLDRLISNLCLSSGNPWEGRYIFWYPYPVYPIRTKNSVKRRSRPLGKYAESWIDDWKQEKKTTTNSIAPGDGIYDTTGRGKKNAWRKERGKESCLQKKKKKRKKTDRKLLKWHQHLQQL